MNDALLSLLGLMRKAGKITMGFDAVIESANKGESLLILTASDVAQRTARQLAFEIKPDVKIKSVPYNMLDISRAIGRQVKILSINDEGFAKKALSLIDKIEEESDI
ncbi:MAG: ribosomal L7Ae/L30e/S12e/Gadd45 family protein [Clostridia bacterium]|nr:ribosomal L7Ae/L30e/S12e/Gadd45 family protein [Clostridia bacterium]